MPPINLCIFGGGSSYTHHMLYAFTRHVISGDLAGSTISLYDLDTENARLMADFGNSIAKARKIDMTLRVSDTLEEGLEGSEFVLSSIRVGGLDQRYLDETIPLKYGLLGQETTGIGGIFMIGRNAAAVEKLARTMDCICPDAFLVNYTNPTGMVCDLTSRVSKVKAFGLCDGVIGVKALVGEMMGLSWPQITQIEAHAAGVNHCTWALALHYQGENLYSRMNELMAGAGAAKATARDPYYRDACRLYQYYGLLPGSLYYARYYYSLSAILQEFQAAGFEYRSENLRRQAAQIRAHCRSQIGKADADFLPHNTEHAAHGDQAIGTIHAIACDTGKMDIVNVKNHGIIANLPDEAIVEVPARLTRQGPVPLSMGPLPDSIAGVVQMVNLHCRLAVSAAHTGDRKLVLQSAMAHPVNRDFNAVEKCLTEMFARNQDFLPQFYFE